MNDFSHKGEVFDGEGGNMGGKGENLGGVLMQHRNVLDEYCNGSLSLGVTWVMG